MSSEKTSQKNSSKGVTEAQKAALLVMSLDEGKAAAVLENMGDEAIARMGEAVEDLKHMGIKEEYKLEALKGFFMKKRRGGVLIGAPGERFQKVLVRALGEDRAKELLPKEQEQEAAPSPMQTKLDYVQSMPDQVLADALSSESPRTGAVLISMLDGERVGTILNLLDAEIREQLLDRLIGAGNISEEISKAILGGFCEAIKKITEAEAKPGPGEHYHPQELSQMLLTLEKESRDRILNQLKEQDPELAEELERLMLQFDDLENVADQSMQELLRNIDTNVVAMALKGAPEAIESKILDNVSARMKERVQEERELSGRVPMRDVQKAREELMQYARQLYREGSLVVAAGGEQFVE